MSYRDISPSSETDYRYKHIYWVEISQALDISTAKTLVDIFSDYKN